MGEGALRAIAGVSRVAVAIGLLMGVTIAGSTTPALGAPAYVEGIDVSHHNGQPIWSQVAAANVRFAIAKVSEAQDWRDGEYPRNKSRAEANGIAFTAYHFARPDPTAGDAVAEANNFVDAAVLSGSNLLPVLDLEAHGGLGPRKLVRWAKAWLSQVNARLGVKAIIYTSPSFWSERMGNSRWFADNGYRLWIAHWGADTPRVPAANWGGKGWTMWQYTSCGSVAGVNGCVDRDHLRPGVTLQSLRISANR